MPKKRLWPLNGLQRCPAPLYYWSMETSEPLGARNSDQDILRKTTWAWGAILASSGVFVFIAFRQAEGNATSPRLFPNFQNPLELALSTMALAMFIASFAVPRMMLLRLERMKKRPDGSKMGITTYLIAKIVSFALAQSCVLYGLVLTMILRTDRIVLPFFALTVISLLANRPSLEEWQALRKRHAF